MLDVVFLKCFIKFQFLVILCDDLGMLSKVDVYVNFKKFEVVEIMVGFFVFDNVIIGGEVQVKIVVWVFEIMCIVDIGVGELEEVGVDDLKCQFDVIVSGVVIEQVSDVGFVDDDYEMVKVV